ncbi:MAG: TIGR02147 family protein [Proteobacteria bacterium]|nr:MAG: TIGR02147 family protein [Pseudomonadota bacterium]
MIKAYSTTIEISEFFDHRKYLAAVVEDLRTQGVFSHRTFNRVCGFSSPNFVQLVIQGKRNLSEQAARRISKVLGLSRESAKVFLELRDMNVTEDPDQKLEILHSLLKLPAFVERYELSTDQLTFYSKWFNVPIRELLQSHPQLTVHEISQALIPKVSVDEIEQSLETMQKLGLIAKSASGWKVNHTQLSTKNEVLHQALFHFHSSMIEIAKQSLSRFTGAEREVSALTLKMTEKEFLLLREKIREFKREALAIESSESDSQVYQFNFQLFPVTEKIKGQQP